MLYFPVEEKIFLYWHIKRFDADGKCNPCCLLPVRSCTVILRIRWFKIYRLGQCPSSQLALNIVLVAQIPPASAERRSRAHLPMDLASGKSHTFWKRTTILAPAIFSWWQYDLFLYLLIFIYLVRWTRKSSDGTQHFVSNSLMRYRCTVHSVSQNITWRLYYFSGPLISSANH